MATGVGDLTTIAAEDLLVRLSDSGEETDDSDDSFDILEAGMDAGEFDEVSYNCEMGDIDNYNDEDDCSITGSAAHYDLSLPGPSTAPVGLVSSSEDSDSSDSDSSDSGSSSDFSDTLSGEETRAKCAKKPVKKWKKGKKFVPKPIKVFDDSNVGIQVPYKLPVHAKEVEYFKLYFDGELVGNIKSETNRYAKQLLDTLRKWLSIMVDELYGSFQVKSTRNFSLLLGF